MEAHGSVTSRRFKKIWQRPNDRRPINQPSNHPHLYLKGKLVWNRDPKHCAVLIVYSPVFSLLPTFQLLFQLPYFIPLSLHSSFPSFPLLFLNLFPCLLLDRWFREYCPCTICSYKQCAYSLFKLYNTRFHVYIFKFYKVIFILEFLKVCCTLGSLINLWFYFKTTPRTSSRLRSFSLGVHFYPYFHARVCAAARRTGRNSANRDWSRAGPVRSYHKSRAAAAAEKCR